MKHIAQKITPQHRYTRWVVLVMLAGSSVAAMAQNMIQSLAGSQQGASDVIRVELSEPLTAAPAGFSVQSPARIALDLPGVGNGTGRNSQELGLGNVRSAVLASSGDRTRLVLNLRQYTTYRTEVQGKTLVVTLDPLQPAALSQAVAPAMAVGSAGGASEAVHFADSQNRAAQALKDIDFRRGRDGAGRVVVELPSTQIGVDIRQQGQNLIVEFPRASLPDKLRRRLDVTDFGTPVQAISSSQAGDRVRLVVEPRGSWEHSAYQTDNQFVLEVRPQKVDPQKLTQGPGYAGEKLSLNFQNIEVRSLLQVIADFTNFNVVTSDSVTGNVTLRLKDVPWDQALDIIMQAKGLGVKKSGNVLWIAPKDELAAKEKQELESKAQVAALEPLRTQSFQLNYTKAEDVAKGLSGQQSNGGGQTTRILSTRGSVISESRTNQLFVTDIPAKLEEISQMIVKIDVPVRQVMIEARIVEAEDTFGRSLGVKLGATDLRGIQGGVPGWGGSTRVGVGGNYSAIGYQTLQTSTTVDFSNSQFVNLPANTSSFGGASAGTFALSLFGAASNRFLNLELSALEAENKGKIVSSPRVITADQVKALIEQGTELPYQTATSSGATAIQFRKANLKLEVTPQITPEGNVILDVDVNKDSVGQQTSAGYAINTKHVKTQVLVENGGTVVIGGIFELTETDSVNKIPVLGDIPYLGALFRNKTKSSRKTELLVFLTPKVVTDRNTAAR